MPQRIAQKATKSKIIKRIGTFIPDDTIFNTSYLTDSYISFTLKMESVTKNTILA